ncbi:MAG: VCBS repeat-containing protein [Sedimentisphaerales bacterium]|nr:VCBS repeat-containing protein [Sedimentisphaerales bacterium]
MQSAQKMRLVACLVVVFLSALCGLTGGGVLNLGPEQILWAGQPALEIDTGDYSVPSFSDFNNDGLSDLISSSGPDEFNMGRVRIYLNQGSVRRPCFDSFFHAQSQTGDLTCVRSGCMVCFPRIVDWDGDEKNDILLGHGDGSVKIFRNIGTHFQPVFDDGTTLTVGQPEQKLPINVMGRATPVLADWNSDGKRDLIVGSVIGWIYIYINEGTDNAPDFRITTFAQTPGGNLTVPSRRSSPEFVDLDGDGKKDLLTGNTDGQILSYRNIGTRESPLFDSYELVEAASNPIDLEGSPRSRPFICDWTGNGQSDLLVGSSDGKVRLYEGQAVGTDSLTVTIAKAGRRLASLQNNDGGWDDPLDDGDPASGSVITEIGTIGLGLAVAYQQSEDPNLLDALERSGQLLLTRTDDFLANEGLLAVELDGIFGTDVYTNHIRSAFYDRLANGTYYDALSGTPNMDTAEYIQSIVEFYGSDLVNTTAWDLGMSLYDAYVIGADTTEWIAAVKTQIDRLDSDKPDDVIGLAGAIFGLASIYEDYDPQNGSHADANSLMDLADILAGYQLASGGFTYNSHFMTAGEDETVTVTAAGILALEAADRYLYWDNIAPARTFLRTDQLLSSGWENYTGAGEDNLVTAETIRGLKASRPTPGDIQDDGRVDLQDLAAQSRYWQRTDCGNCAGADLNRDGQVNLFDLMILVEHWTDGL